MSISIGDTFKTVDGGRATIVHILEDCEYPLLGYVDTGLSTFGYCWTLKGKSAVYGKYDLVVSDYTPPSGYLVVPVEIVDGEYSAGNRYLVSWGSRVRFTGYVYKTFSGYHISHLPNRLDSDDNIVWPLFVLVAED